MKVPRLSLPVVVVVSLYESVELELSLPVRKLTMSMVVDVSLAVVVSFSVRLASLF